MRLRDHYKYLIVAQYLCPVSFLIQEEALAVSRGRISDNVARLVGFPNIKIGSSATAKVCELSHADSLYRLVILKESSGNW